MPGLKPNAIYCGDCTEVIHNHIPNESIDLIYVDPPFFSNRFYEVLWHNGYELRAFEDRWKGGIENYIAWMEPKLRQCERVLKKGGCIYLHCDWHANAHLRILMDSIFKKGLINEIIWKRQTAHSDVKQGAKHLGRLHDVILLYSKGKPRAWNMEYTQYDTSYIENFYKFIESDTGRRYRLSDLTAAKPGGDTRYSWKGVVPHVGRYWAYSKENMEEFERQGRLVYPKKRGGVPQYKRYLDEMLGVPLQDVWTDILPVQSRQRRGPTQKPMSLLERIIKLSSNPTDIVLDPMCGYGTTIIAAHKLGRRWIGIDISPTSCKFMAKEIQKVGARDVEIIGLPKTVEEIKKMQPFEFQNWIMEKLIAHPSKVKVGDMGVDGRLINGTPIQVKHSENVGRNVVDNFETAIKRERKTKGIIVALSFGKGAYEEAARIKNQGELDIRLMTIEDIIREE